MQSYRFTYYQYIKYYWIIINKRKLHQLIHPWIVPSVIFLSLSLLAAWFGHYQSQGQPEVNVVWYSVLPPLFAIVVAISTRRLFVSFGCSILLGLILSSVLTAEQAEFDSWLQAFGNQSAQIIDNTIGTSLSGQSVSLFNGQVIIFVILMCFFVCARLTRRLFFCFGPYFCARIILLMKSIFFRHHQNHNFRG